MIKHVVLFKLKKMESDEAKLAKLSEIKLGLDRLLGIIPELKAIEVGINSNPAESYDLLLNTLFDDMKGLEVYANHPEHLKVVKVIGEVKEARACVDYIV